MKQLNLTIYGETEQEMLYYLLKIVQKMKNEAPVGRIQEVRPGRNGRPAITTMAKFDTGETPWRPLNLDTVTANAGPHGQRVR